MLQITPDQLNSLQQDRRARLIERIDGWLVHEDAHWPRVPEPQRKAHLETLLPYGDQAGLQSERDFAVFCRACLFLKGEWRAFVEAEPQRALLLDEKADINSKLRAFFYRCRTYAKAKG